MSSGSDRSSVEVKFGTSPQDARVKEDDVPFRMAILGHFSGRISEGPLSPREINRDNFDQALDQLQPQLDLQLPGAASPLTLGFRSLKDFDPDHLIANVSVFAPLSDLRRRLQDTSTFATAAAELKALSGQTIEPAPKKEPPARSEPELEEIDAPQIESGGSLLDQVLDVTADGVAETASASDDVQRMVRDVVRPYLEPAADPRQTELVAVLDRIVSELMSAILHHPTFRALEAAWRSVYLLTRRLETGRTLKLYIIDLAKEQLAADLLGHDDLTLTSVYRTLVEPSVGMAGGQPWALWVGNYSFDKTVQDVGVLGRIGALAGAAGAPFVASGHPHFVGCEVFAQTPDPRDWTWSCQREAEEAWQRLRQVPEAATNLALTMPRFLLRLPYGKQTNPIASFDFDEMSDPPQHDDYLWGNGAFVCAYLLATAFSRDGWQLQLDSQREMDKLPVHLYQVDGESRVKPCAEVGLTDRAAQAIQAQGFIPLISIKDRDAVLMGVCQSVATPTTVLRGRWLA